MSDQHTFEYLCIGCPLGCHLLVDDTEGDAEGIKVTGWSCKTGKAYGEQEHKDPRRNIATSVRVKGARWGRVPVKTTGTVPKKLVRDVARAVQDIEVEAPIKLGTVVLANVLGTGVDIVATRDMERL